MASKVERIVQHALKCFTRNNMSYPETLQSDLVVLKELVDGITLKDMKFVRFLLQKAGREFANRKAMPKIDPVVYLHIYENEDVSVGVFVLKPGSKLPIHDHPGMYGMLKVLQGVIKVTNYSVVGTDTTIPTVPAETSSFFYQNALKVIKHPEVIICERDGCSTLTPTERSIHDVECVNGPAAFLDILAPPYDDDNSSLARGCHYFKELENAADDEYVRLMQIPNPGYWASQTKNE